MLKIANHILVGLFLLVPSTSAASPWSLEQALGPERLSLSLQILLFLTVLLTCPH